VGSAGARVDIFGGGVLDVGGTGARKSGRIPRTRFTPTVYFDAGRDDHAGFRWAALKARGGDGDIRRDVPTEGEQNRWVGAGVEYSLPYFANAVRDNRVAGAVQEHDPLGGVCVHDAGEPGERADDGDDQPGVLYQGGVFQLRCGGGDTGDSPTGASRRRGERAGFLDDIFPRTFGHPLFGGRTSDS